MMYSNKQLFTYGLPSLPLSALYLPAVMFLPYFYAVDLGLGLTAVGVALVGARLFDVFTDPFVGILSDRRLIGGKKHAGWIVAGAMLVALFTWLVFVPIESLVSIEYLFATMLVLYIGWTMVQIPLYALGADMSNNYHERTKIMAWRDGLSLLGTVLALVFLIGDISRPAMLRYIAIGVVVLMPITALVLFKQNFVPTTIKSSDNKEKRSFKDRFAILANNKPFIRTLGAYFVNGLANSIPATTFILFVEKGLGRPDLTGLLLFLYFGCGFVALPLWVMLSKKLGKALTWRAAMLLAIIVFGCVFFMTSDDVALFYAIVVGSGLCVGADLALPSSIQTDVIDIDRIETGEDRSGLFFSFWGVATKLSLALAVGIAYPLLDMMGCSQDACTDFNALIWVYAGLPIAIKIMAIVILWKDPVSEEDHETLQKTLQS